MALHTKFAVLAKRLIEKHGREVSLVFPSQDVSDIDQPWRGSHDGEENVLDLIAYIGDYESQDVDQNIVQHGDKKMLVAADSIVVAGGTTYPDPIIENVTFVEDGGLRWRVESQKSVNPGETEIYYELRLVR